MGFDPNSAPRRITNRSEFLEGGEWLRNAVKADSGASSEDFNRVRGMINAYRNFIEAKSKICSRLSDPYITLIDLIVMNGREWQYMHLILKLRDHAFPMCDVMWTYEQFGYSLNEDYELTEKKPEPEAVGPDPATVPSQEPTLADTAYDSGASDRAGRQRYGADINLVGEGRRPSFWTSRILKRRSVSRHQVVLTEKESG